MKSSVIFNIITAFIAAIILSACGDVSDVKAPPSEATVKEKDTLNTIKIMNIATELTEPLKVLHQLTLLKTKSSLIDTGEYNGEATEDELPIIGPLFKDKNINISATSINAFPPSLSFRIEFTEYNMDETIPENPFLNGTLFLDIELDSSLTESSLLIRFNTSEDSLLMVNNEIITEFSDLSCRFNSMTFALELIDGEGDVSINNVPVDAGLLKNLMKKLAQPSDNTSDEDATQEEQLTGRVVNPLLTGDPAVKLQQQLMVLEYLSGNIAFPEESLPADVDAGLYITEKIDLKKLTELLRLPENGLFFSGNGMNCYLTDLSTNPNYVTIKATFENFESGDEFLALFDGNLFINAHIEAEDFDTLDLFLEFNTQENLPLQITTPQNQKLDFQFDKFTIKVSCNGQKPDYISGNVVVNDIPINQAPISVIFPGNN